MLLANETYSITHIHIYKLHSPYTALSGGMLDSLEWYYQTDSSGYT